MSLQNARRACRTKRKRKPVHDLPQLPDGADDRIQHSKRSLVKTNFIQSLDYKLPIRMRVDTMKMMTYLT